MILNRRKFVGGAKGLLTALIFTAASVHAQKIPARSLQAPPELVDLTDYYSSSLHAEPAKHQGIDLAVLPRGLQIFCQTAFDVRGVIQLSGKPGATEGEDEFPKEVKGIKINGRAASVQFLHGAIGAVPDDTRIGEYVLHYADGKIVHLPIVYQRQLRNGLRQKGDPLPTDADVAWSGANDTSQKLDRQIQLYCYTAKNPFPELEIVSLDMISALTDSQPFLIAVSLVTNKSGNGFLKSFRPVRIDNKIIPRGSEVSPELIDLSAHFNTSPDDDWTNYPGHDFQDLPRGVQSLGGVKFDVRGMIAVASGSSLRSSRVLFPEAINAMGVHQKARQLHFLQGCAYSDKPGAKIGEYRIHYVDGQTLSAPVVYQENVLDWWTRADDAPLPKAVEAWRGANPSSRSAGRGTHLFRYTWENPLPTVEIDTIDFVSGFATAVPFLLAITIN